MYEWSFCPGSLPLMMTGPDPVVRIPASQPLINDLFDEHPMDENELLDFADQEPLPSPTF
jgi:hypothetical protein